MVLKKKYQQFMKCKDCVVVDMLENRQKDTFHFITSGILENIDWYYLSQPLFELSLLIRENSNFYHFIQAKCKLSIKFIQ